MSHRLEEVVFLVEEAPEGGYTAHGLGISIVTEAETLEQLRRQVVDAMRCHFDGQQHHPRLIRLHLVNDEVLTA